MLGKLDSRWRVVAQRKIGGDAEFAQFLLAFPGVPSEFEEIARTSTEYELQHALVGQYFRIWPPASCLSMDAAHSISKRIPGAIPIGDDGGDRAIVYARQGDTLRIFAVPFGAMAPDELRFIAPNLRGILERSEGVKEDDIW